MGRFLWIFRIIGEGEIYPQIRDITLTLAKKGKDPDKGTEEPNSGVRQDNTNVNSAEDTQGEGLKCTVSLSRT